MKFKDLSKREQHDYKKAHYNRMIQGGDVPSLNELLESVFKVTNQVPQQEQPQQLDPTYLPEEKDEMDAKVSMLNGYLKASQKAPREEASIERMKADEKYMKGFKKLEDIIKTVVAGVENSDYLTEADIEGEVKRLFESEVVPLLEGE